MVLDLAIHLSALLFAYLIRFDLKADFSLIQSEWAILSKSLWLYILIKVLVFQAFQIHKGLVRYTSTEDLKRIFLAETCASGLFILGGMLRYYYVDHYFLFPSSVLIMELIFSVAFVVGARFVIKLLYLERTKNTEHNEPVIIYGAGVSGLITKRTIDNDTLNQQKIVGFLDENPKLQGTRIEGQRVFSPTDLPELVRKHSIKTLIVAIQSPDPAALKNVVNQALLLDVKVQRIPQVKSWVNGAFSLQQLKKIDIETLLGREAISLNNPEVAAQLNHKRILITGAAGSIGSGIAKALCQLQNCQLIVLDQAESPLFELEHELRSNFAQQEVEVVVGDICDQARMKQVFALFQPQYVFHAAAYKHVPLMELNPAEAIRNNIGGTKVLADLALEFAVEKFVMISTDKAVNPTNVMGASKRIAEIYVQNKNSAHKTAFITTRFGNVLGSNGSVIPLFQKQLEAGGPLTVTDERITRFFMTIPEACQLVLEAATMGKGSEIFVFEMGESVKIVDLAYKMIQLSGLRPGIDIQVVFTGLRPGEKLYEEVLATEENTLPTHHPKILIAKTRAVAAQQLDEIEQLVQLAVSQDNFKCVALMKQLVPEYISNNSPFQELDK
ncbi:MAG: hypothetical protein RLZZ301_1359 [Bacteroidota bacterium]